MVNIKWLKNCRIIPAVFMKNKQQYVDEN